MVRAGGGIAADPGVLIGIRDVVEPAGLDSGIDDRDLGRSSDDGLSDDSCRSVLHFGDLHFVEYHDVEFDIHVDDLDRCVPRDHRARDRSVGPRTRHHRVPHG
jgi:hypothetical protein